MSMEALVRGLAQPDTTPRWSFMAGVVTAVTGTTVNVDLAGGAVQPLRYPQGTTPAVGAPVWVACKDNAAMFVAFVLA